MSSHPSIQSPNWNWEPVNIPSVSGVVESSLHAAIAKFPEFTQEEEPAHKISVIAPLISNTITPISIAHSISESEIVFVPSVIVKLAVFSWVIAMVALLSVPVYENGQIFWPTKR